jgi:phosphoribosylaminoimidazole carboxylase PurK protein
MEALFNQYLMIMNTITIGIVGGGQLGRMLKEASGQIDISIVVIDPTPNSPSAQAGAQQVIATFDDASAIEQLSKKVDILTIESEHINIGALEKATNVKRKVYPTPSAIEITQDKLLEKQFLSKIGVSVPEYVEIQSVMQAHEVLHKFGGAMVIKKRIGGYDGKGNYTVRGQADIINAFKNLGESGLYAERFVNFTKELAIMVARDVNGNVVTYPVTETIQKNHICHLVFAPANISKTLTTQAEEIGKKVVQNLDSPGIFGVEMFLTQDGQILGNEIAPRVHNSGHYTIEACYTSQFEQHLRAIAGLPLGNTEMKVKASVMINILGEREGDAQPRGVSEAESIEGVSVHIYGKAETRVGRKMGHITVVADTIKEAREKATLAREKVSI